MAIDLQQIHDSSSILDILIQMEDVLDSLDIYVFKNWLDGEVIDGPVVRRYWLDFALRYPKDKMPDPRGALRLIKHGLRVDITRAREEGDAVNPLEKTQADLNQEDGSETQDHDIWLVKISVPRRLVVQINSAQHDFYDEVVDVDNVEDAQDAGLDDENIHTYRGQEVANPDGPNPELPPSGGPQ